MNEQHHHGSGGFVNGFVLGLLVGAGLVFLFGTSKGKRVLQMLLDQVEENTAISELLEMPEDEELEEEEMEEPSLEKSVAEEPKSAEAKSHPVTKVKRFFKSAPKKLVS